MSKYIMSIALLGTLLVAVPAMADFELFKTWRNERGAGYGDEYQVVTLGTLGKFGASNATNGTISFVPSNDYWTGWQTGANVKVTTINPLISVTGNTWWIDYNGLDTTTYADMGIALTGALGSGGIAGVLATGIQSFVGINIPEQGWATVALALSSLASSMGVTIEKQSYLNGAKSTSTTVNTSTDPMQTFMWSSMITEIFGGAADSEFVMSGAGGVEVVFAGSLRNGSALSLVGIVGPQPEPPISNLPEPATLALMGLGLAGLGIARRRMKK